MAINMKVTLPNGTAIELNNDLTIQQVQDTLAALGITNGVAVETQSPSGAREVRVVEPQGTRKGL